MSARKTPGPTKTATAPQIKTKLHPVKDSLAVELSISEVRMISAYRRMSTLMKNEALAIVDALADASPRYTAPDLRLVVGGAT